MANNEVRSGEDSLKEEEPESAYSSVEQSFSTSKFYPTFYTRNVLKKKQSCKILVFLFTFSFYSCTRPPVDSPTHT